MRAARVENSLVTALWEVGALDAFAGVTLVAAPDDVAVGWGWDGTGFTAPAPDMVAARAAHKARIEAWRDAAANAPVTALGTTWDADAPSRALLGQAIALASAGLPLPPVWRDARNNTVPVAALADLLAIAGAMAAQIQAAYATSWARKAAADAAATPETLAEIVW